ncbi:MAG: L-threonylcarbamoyladenylate synthase [Ignavibacteriota bacterium]
METITGTDIEHAIGLLSSGEVVAIPTETVYGLAANALDAHAVTKIFEIKERPFFDPLIVHVQAIEAIKKYVVEIPQWAKKLAAAFMPGPVTLLLNKNELIPDIVTAGLPRVGIRIPAHPIAIDLLAHLEFPLAAPSANPFGYISPTTAQHVRDQLGGRIPYILDGGACRVGVESTIIGENENGLPTIFRFGGMSVEEIEAIIGACEVQTHSSSNPASPGKLENHYAPKHPLIFGEMDFKNFLPSEIGIISFDREYDIVPSEKQRILSPAGDLREAAQNIFSAMRSLDSMDIKIIFAEHFPETGLGRAINDRLKRASVVR